MFTNLNKTTKFIYLQAIIRIRELLKELEKNNETAQNLKQEFDEYKITCEKVTRMIYCLLFECKMNSRNKML
jgi:hypothetical protein